MCLSLPKSLAAWPGEAFTGVLLDELALANPASLRLERLLQHGSHIVDTPEFMLLGTEADTKNLRVRVGVFLHSVMAGCACADDPTPMDIMNEYGELRLTIDRDTAGVEVQAA